MTAKLTIVKSTQPRIDENGDALELQIRAGDLLVAEAKRAKHGPGFFLQVLGSTWQNSPGARYPQEKDLRTKYTYCRTQAQMLDRVRAVLKEREALAQANRSG
jgi:hypothetical protein